MQEAVEKESKAVSKEHIRFTPRDLFELHKPLLQLDRTRKLFVSKALQGKSGHFILCMEEKSHDLS